MKTGMGWVLSWSLVLMFACTEKKDTASKVDVAFTVKGVYGDQPLQMYNQNYPYEAGMKIRLQNFQFYLSDIVLLKESRDDADSVKLTEIVLATFRDVQSLDAASNGLNFSFKNIPAGNYKGLRVGIGVAPRLNATSPNSYTPPHPLDDNYWSWALGYVFTKIEGNADIIGDGKFAEKLTFHIGGNDFYRKKTYFKDIVLQPGAANHLQLKVDLRKVLALDSNQFVDFRKVTQDHINDKVLAKFIADNLVNALEWQSPL
jgi:hypothetical protein